MIFSWLITTISISILTFLVEHVSHPTNPVVFNIVSSFLVVIIINLFFWLPVVKYLHKNKKVSLSSSVISSIASAFIGGACTIGIIILLFYAAEQFQQADSMAGQATGYTDWTIGHIYYLPGIVSIIVLWGANGILFWKLYGKFATNN
jgi:ABC-type Fe3+ transport system permease subunit